MRSETDPKAIVRAGYDRVSHAYRNDPADAYGDYAGWLDRLCALLPVKPRILDLGCGCGLPFARLAAARGRLSGIDISPVQIERARSLVPSGRFACDDMCRARFADGAFDGIASFWSIIHVPLEEQPALLQRIGRWLAPGGAFIGTLGETAWTGTEPHWLGVDGATMYWSHADAATYRNWLEEAGLTVIADERVPEGDGGHRLFLARKGA